MKGIKKRDTGVKPHRDLEGLGKAGLPTDGLRLVHLTAVGAGKLIIEAGKLQTKQCTVFDKKHLVYFFVSKAAYRLKDESEKSDQISRFPFVLIFLHQKLGAPFHVYPFDTGAAHIGIFEDTPDPYVPLNDYELAPTLEAAAAHIDWAFGDLETYLKGQLRANLDDELTPFDQVIASYLKIARLGGTGSNNPDDRASSIEVAYDKHIPLQGHLELVILPKQFLEHPKKNNDGMIAALQALGVGWKTYDWQPNRAPEDFREEINDILASYLAGLGP